MKNGASLADKYRLLRGIEFVGDLSLEDASILVEYGVQSRRILEFGVGGSTMILAQCLPDVFVSVDTDNSWIYRTLERLSKIINKTRPEIFEWPHYQKTTYDLIFVDGRDDLRRSFAIDTWDLLSPTGVMIFHDTRRFADFQNAAWIAQLHHNEINNIAVNAKGSNMTVISKKKHEPYVNWNYSEGKPLWCYGAEPNPNGDSLWSVDDVIE